MNLQKRLSKMLDVVFLWLACRRAERMPLTCRPSRQADLFEEAFHQSRLYQWYHRRALRAWIEVTLRPVCVDDLPWWPKGAQRARWSPERGCWEAY